MLNVNLQLIVIFEIYKERERGGERQTDRQKKDDSIGWKGGKRITSD